MENISAAYPDVLVRRMQMDFAWHSHLLDEVEDWFRSELGEVDTREGRIPIVSTVTGMIETRFDADYWWHNLRQPVSFTKGISLCIDLGIDTFLELGPHRTLTPLAKGVAQDRGVNNVVSVTSLERKADDFRTLARAEADLFVAGVEFDRAQRGNPLTQMPRLPWNNQQLKELSEETESFLFDPVPHPLLGRRDFASTPSWSSEVTLKSFKYLVDHRVSDDVLFPAVGFVEIMGAALRDYFGDGSVELRDFKLHEATSISNDDIVMFATHFDPVTSRLVIHTMHRGFDRGWHLRAEAYGFRHDYKLERASGPLFEADMQAVDKIEFYRLAERHGLQYGPAFQLLNELHANDDR
ncbi:acyltransferase domain-containing protein, partial [bacterium]